MKVFTAGHKYGLVNFENPQLKGQIIQFIEKEPIQEGSTMLRTVNNGTTNEEVLAVLIDRITYLNNKFPCKENAVALTHIETALLWLEKRTADREKRKVEGTNKA